MEFGTILMIVLVLSGIWGGFIFCIVLAWKKEKMKLKNKS